MCNFFSFYNYVSLRLINDSYKSAQRKFKWTSTAVVVVVVLLLFLFLLFFFEEKLDSKQCMYDYQCRYHESKEYVANGNNHVYKNKMQTIEQMKYYAIVFCASEILIVSNGCSFCNSIYLREFAFVRWLGVQRIKQVL